MALRKEDRAQAAVMMRGNHIAPESAYQSIHEQFNSKQPAGRKQEGQMSALLKLCTSVEKRNLRKNTKNPDFQSEKRKCVKDENM